MPNGSRILRIHPYPDSEQPFALLCCWHGQPVLLSAKAIVMAADRPFMPYGMANPSRRNHLAIIQVVVHGWVIQFSCRCAPESLSLLPFYLGRRFTARPYAANGPSLWVPGHFLRDPHAFVCSGVTSASSSFLKPARQRRRLHATPVSGGLTRHRRRNRCSPAPWWIVPSRLTTHTRPSLIESAPPPEPVPDPRQHSPELVPAVEVLTPWWIAWCAISSTAEHPELPASGYRDRAPSGLRRTHPS